MNLLFSFFGLIIKLFKIIECESLILNVKFIEFSVNE